LPLLDDSDALIFSDFNYGCLPQPLVEDLTRHAMGKNVFIMADSQSSSQMGDVSRFCNAGLLTPTEREARLAVHDFESGLVVLAEKLLKKASAHNVFMSLGEAGLLIQPNGSVTDQLPAFNQAAKDVAGAGDSLLVSTGLALAAGGDVWHAACLGSLAAAVQVSREGNIPLTAEEISQCIRAWR
jgi:bifunctional ADP-heptose synthase (sugar kinase/adenylyltransferase)